MTHHVDEGREEHQDDGEDAHKSAVQPGLDDALGERLQRHWETLKTDGVKEGVGVQMTETYINQLDQ